MRGRPVTIVALCFGAVLLDGFDAAALAFTVPSLAASWGSPVAAFTPALVLGNVGVVIGYVLAGPLGARCGARLVLVGGTALFAVTSIATALVLPLASIGALSAVRTVTGVGLGLGLPSAVAIATRVGEPRRRQTISVAVTLGLSAGAAVAGVLGGPMLRSIGVAGVFWVGGLVPLVLAVATVLALPAAPLAEPTTGTGSAPDARVSRLVVAELRTATLLLWTFAFLVFIAAYTLLNWVPTLLTFYGFSPTQAPVGLAFLNVGGVVGGLLLMAVASRWGIARSLTVAVAFGCVAIVVAAVAGLGGLGLLIAIGCAGAGVVSGQIGQLALAVSIYDAGSVTTGVGWAAAFGRIGSIVGPGVAGVLLALAMPGNRIVLLISIPVFLAVLCVAVIARRMRRAGPAPSAVVGPPAVGT